MSDTRFKAGDPHTVACSRKGKAASPLGQQPIPLNRNAKRTLRLEAIKRAARKHTNG